MLPEARVGAGRFVVGGMLWALQQGCKGAVGSSIADLPKFTARCFA